ncbi:MAG: hypothetical protein AUI14_05640 [Actinobacteria bacterium 13_2_20CM_2_71_6]|nr:MAG: hypothetical protein AUI14_05640 [Actinobacteria bacterium 13_2_20CM_2_71_6]
MEFRLLGPVEVWARGRLIDLGHAKQRSVLVLLLLEAGRVVPVATLVDRVWGHAPPDSALNVLYGYIARLRKALTPTGVRLVRRSGGDLVDVDPDEVDVHRFHRLLAEAATGGDPQRMAATYDEALALWRGTPFADVTSDWLASVAEALDSERLSALVERNEAYLRGGRHVDLVESLRELVARYPLDERPVGQLMLALFRSGRESEALDAYRQARLYLADQLGTEPGPALRQLHQRILRGDPGLAEPELPVAGSLPVPAGLPHDVPGFVGRHDELAQLDKLVSPGATRQTVVISAVHGTAGVGKTALAVHWAHRVRAEFPDGNLYADLRGYGPGPRADPAEVLDGFLAILDVAPGKIPADPDAKAAMYRSLLDGRQLLVVLDNAADAQQIRPLLPGSSSCPVVITSRTRLPGLAARDRAHRITLDVLPHEEAVALLEQFIGSARVAAEPAAASELATLCARLPVALCVAGERAASRPGTTLRQLATQLRTAGRRLDLLDAEGDPATAVRAVFSWSYRNLSAPTQRMFRMLGLHPGDDVDRYAAAALAAIPVDQAAELLDKLVGAHLVERAGTGRFRMHDLLREYAAERATEHSGSDRRAAQARLFDWYLRLAAAAVRTLYPAEHDRLPDLPSPDPAGPPTATPAEAKVWLDTERRNLVATTVYAAERGWAAHAGSFAAVLATYLDAGAHYTDASVVQRHALDAARGSADRAAEALALHNLGTTFRRRGHYAEAFEHYLLARAAFEAIGDRASEGRTLAGLGVVSRLRGRLEEAIEYYRQGLAVLRTIGDRAGESIMLGNLGIVYDQVGRYDEALDHYHRALVLCREIGDRDGESITLGNLGGAYGRLGRNAEALDHLGQAVAIAREIGDRAAEANALDELGVVCLGSGREDEAHDHLTLARTIQHEIGNRGGEAAALDHLGLLSRQRGRYDDARADLERAVAIAREIGDRSREASARNGLGEVDRAAGRGAPALEHHAAWFNRAAFGHAPAMAVLGVAKFERFFRLAAGLDVDKDDLRRYNDFVGRKLYYLLIIGQANAKANGRDIVAPRDLPITKGLEESIHTFRELDEDIELRPILEQLTTYPPLEHALGEETEARLPFVVGGLSLALARTFKTINSTEKNPATDDWSRVFQIFDLLL